MRARIVALTLFLATDAFGQGTIIRKGSSTPANMVTTDTVQTISGAKTFSLGIFLPNGDADDSAIEWGSEGIYRTVGTLRFTLSGSQRFTFVADYMQINHPNAALYLNEVQLFRSGLNVLSVFGTTANTGFINPPMGAAIASAATITPVAQVTHVTGTVAIATITVPAGAVSGLQITLIPDGLWTTTTAGNIALASTAVVNRTITFTWDSTAVKWFPSM